MIWQFLPWPIYLDFLTMKSTKGWQSPKSCPSMKLGGSQKVHLDSALLCSVIKTWLSHLVWSVPDRLPYASVPLSTSFFFNAYNIHPEGIQRFLTFVQDFWMSGNLIRAVVGKIWTYPLHMRVSTLQCICNEANWSTMHVLHRWPVCTL